MNVITYACWDYSSNMIVKGATDQLAYHQAVFDGTLAIDIPQLDIAGAEYKWPWRRNVPNYGLSRDQVVFCI